MKKLIFCLMFLFFAVSPVVQASEGGDWEFSVSSWAVQMYGYPSVFEGYTLKLSDEPIYYITSASNTFGVDGEMSYFDIQTMGDSFSIPVYKISNGRWGINFWEISERNSLDEKFQNEDSGMFQGLILPGNPQHVLAPFPNKNSENGVSGIKYTLVEGWEVLSVDITYALNHLEFGIKYLDINNDFGYKTATSGCWYGTKIMSGKDILEAVSRVEFQGAGPYIGFKDQFENEKWKLSYDIGFGVVLGSGNNEGMWGSKSSRTISWINFNEISSSTSFYEVNSGFDESKNRAIIVTEANLEFGYQITKHFALKAGVKAVSMANMPLAPVFTVPTEYGVTGTWSERSEDIVLAGVTLGISYTW